jgi:NADPH:quinone reductase-like Zn-dependent oxidoreductase
MKAVRFHEHGTSEVLRYEDAPDPAISSTEVLVRVKACALNHLDIHLRRGVRKMSLPHIVGADVAGEIATVGAEVRGWKAGQKVLLQPGVSCGVCAACLSGDDNLCRQYAVLGSVQDGGYAELVKVPEANVLPYPEGLSWEQAAAVPLVFLTAWHMLINRARMRIGDTILVIGAGSGVGSAAIQIVKLFHGRVITVAGSDAKLAKAREIGADETINHATQDITAEVKRITGKRGVDVVFEHVGQATWNHSYMSLATGGRLVTCGVTSGYEANLDLRYLFSKNLSLIGSFMGRKDELIELLTFVKQGKLKPVVDRVFPLAEARAAQEYVERREQFGKVVLVVP